MLQDVFVLLTERKTFFLELLGEHLAISLISIFIAMIVGLIIGIVISEYQEGSKFVLGIVNFIYTIPSISLLGFLIPFSGIGNTTAIIALTVYALLPMVRNTHTGMTHIDERILEAAKGMGSTPFQILYKIKLPLAAPVIMSGIRSMATMTLALGGIASFIGAGGLGVAIYRGITTNNVAMTIAGSLLIAILAIVVDGILGLVEKMIGKRSRKGKATSLVLAGGTVAAMIFLIAVTLSGGGSKTLRVATKPMTEQYILGEMLKLYIEDGTDMEVELTQGIGGGTSNIQPAMEKGEFDLYPEYTGTGWNMVLKRDGLYSEEMFDLLEGEYEERLGMTWMGMYGFNNTYGIAVRREIVEEYDLKTYSDLAEISDQLIFGAGYDFFERKDGYNALREAYQMDFKSTMDMDIGLKYQAIKEGKIDVMSAFTTDGQLSTEEIVVLEDDKNFYPSYMCGNVLRMDTLEKHPELEPLLNDLEGILTDREMAEMNYQVESEGREPKEVALEFLERKDLLKGGMNP